MLNEQFTWLTPHSQQERWGIRRHRRPRSLIFTEPIASHGHQQSLRLNLPPLGFLLLKPAG